MNIIERQTITIHRDTTNVQSWYEDLGLNFTPDTVVVRQVTCIGSGAITTLAITVPWIESRDNILVTFLNELDVPFVSNPMIHYRLKESGNLMNGQTRFGLNIVTDILGPNTTDCQLTVTLEFQLHMEQRNIEDVVISGTTAMIKLMAERGCIYPFCLPNTSQRGQGPEGQLDINANVENIPDLDRTPQEPEPVVPVVPAVPIVNPAQVG